MLQLDCPDLAMSRHNRSHRQRWPSSASIGELHIEALNEATEDIPPERMRLHLCWGNYEGPHHLDVPLADIIDIVLHGAARRASPSRAPTRVTSTSGRSSRTSSCPTARSSSPA